MSHDAALPKTSYKYFGWESLGEDTGNRVSGTAGTRQETLLQVPGTERSMWSEKRGRRRRGESLEKKSWTSS